MSALFSAGDLMEALGGTMTQPFHATGVSIDTRTLQPGDLFVALQTDSGDGHDHVGAALAKGAAGALVHRQHGLPDDAPLVVVGDTLAGLTALGAFARRRFTGSVVAITGSVGKTTTKEMLRVVLGACGRTHASVASYNNHWGVPLTLARLPPDADYAVIEIGMNHPGEIAPLAKLAGPDVAVITSVAAAHIGHMGSIEAIADEKASIAQGVLQGGTVVLPGDSALVERLEAGAAGREVVRFSAAQAHIVREDAAGTVFDTPIGGRTLVVTLNVPGRHMVHNAVAALTAAQALGADAAIGAAALSTFMPLGGRGTQRAILDGRALLLDESYNASGASVRAALSVLRITPARRRVAVLGDMLELGDHSRAEHESLAEAVRESADVLYACGPWMKFLFDALPADQRGAYAADSARLADILAADLRGGDAVLIKGSLGSRMRLVVDAVCNATAGSV
jgi:UDP-N-acetylmuramoyl-tripeptide--D-alanyl-D-alanine ligase